MLWVLGNKSVVCLEKVQVAVPAPAVEVATAGVGGIA